MPTAPRFPAALLACLALATLPACGTLSDLFGSRKVDYRTANRLPPLEVPPDLTQPTPDDRYVAPEPKPGGGAGAATYSGYSRDRAAGAAAGAPVAGVAGVPLSEKAHVERDGSQRWLVVNAPADQVWPQVKAALTDANLQVKTESPSLGILETEWAESHPRVPETGIRALLQRGLNTIYSTGLRDKYRVRLERPTPDVTEVYVSHLGMEEVYEGSNTERTKWQPRPLNPDLEAEMLRRILVKFGTDDAKAATQMTQAQPGTARARIDKGPDGVSRLAVVDPFDRSWRRVGLALDRVGFTVEDRDRSKGLYFVRYIDPQAEDKADKSWLSSLAFWRSDEPKSKDPRYQYRIQVSDAGKESVVEVRNSAGQPDASPTAGRILNLLLAELR